MWPRIPSLLWAALLAAQGVHGFGFTHTDPVECGDLTVTWEGGSPPFRLLIIPDGQTLRNLSIPDSSYDGTTGSFTTPMPWTAGARFLLAMSDATDLTAGGITDILTLGSANGAPCTPDTIQADFFFSLPGQLEQCGQFPFTDYGRATRPVSLFGFVPNGRHFSVEGVQDETFSWRVTEPAGTSIFFFMTDALQRNGGVAAREVGPSGDSGCLPAVRPSSSASSTGTRPSVTSSSSRKPSPSGGTDDDSSTGDEKKEGNKSNIGLIVGAAAGGFVALGLFAFIAVFCFKRKKKQNNATGEVKIDIDGAPPGPFKSPSNTYLLPSSYNGSNSNLAPNQPAAPYTQQSYQSSASYGAPMGGASLQTRPSYQASTPTVSTHPSEYNPYAANEMGAMGHYNHAPQQSISNASAVSPYGGMSSGQSTSTAGYPPSSGYGMAAAGAGAYSAYNQYQQQQQQQYQAPNHQHYPPPSTQQYNVGPAGPLYATNADPPSTPFTPNAPTAAGKSTHKASGSTEKRPPQAQAPQRVIQHQDIDESELPEELPPQYSERRAPIPGLPSSIAGGSHKPDRKS